MKALELFKARQKNESIASDSGLNPESLPVLPVEKTRLATTQATNHKVVASVAAVASDSDNAIEDFLDFEDVVIVQICNECDFFQPDQINPHQGMGRCELGVNRKNKPLYPMQDACDKSKPLTPF